MCFFYPFFVAIRDEKTFCLYLKINFSFLKVSFSMLTVFWCSTPLTALVIFLKDKNGNHQCTYSLVDLLVTEMYFWSVKIRKFWFFVDAYNSWIGCSNVVQTWKTKLDTPLFFYNVLVNVFAWHIGKSLFLIVWDDFWSVFYMFLYFQPKDILISIKEL